MRAEAPRMDHALGDAFVVEMKDLLAEVMVLEQGRAAPSDFKGVLVVGDRRTLLGGEHGHVAAGDLVRLAAAAAHDLLFAQLGRFELIIVSALFCHRNSFPYWKIAAVEGEGVCRRARVRPARDLRLNPVISCLFPSAS